MDERAFSLEAGSLAADPDRAIVASVKVQLVVAKREVLRGIQTIGVRPILKYVAVPWIKVEHRANREHL
jgi:hypothetical protein